MDDLSRVLMAIPTANKERELIDFLRTLYQQIILNVNPLGSNVGERVLPVLWDVLLGRKRGTKTRAICTHLLMHVWATSKDPPTFLQSNFPSRYKDVRQLVWLFRLLISVGDTTGASANIRDLVHIILSQSTPLQTEAFTTFACVVRQFPKSINHASHIQPVEAHIAERLLNSRSVQELQKSPNNLFSTIKLSITASQPVTEMDGSISRDFFTVLNFSSQYSVEQELNISAFSLLYPMLLATYGHGRPKYVEEEYHVEKTSFSPRIHEGLKDALVSYCKRILEQCRLKGYQKGGIVGGTGSGGGGGMGIGGTTTSHLSALGTLTSQDVTVAAHMEAVRILDLLCMYDKTLINSVFSTVKKAAGLAGKGNNGILFLAYLQFFMNHSSDIVHDPRPSFQTFFDNFASKGYMDALLVFETFHFLNKNKRAILENTEVFATYYPVLLKMIAWFPFSYKTEVKELLPAIISPRTYMEVFHSLLDLPLVSAALERNYRDQALDPTYEWSNSRHRVVYNYVLRNESGVSINFWQQARGILDAFLQSTGVTPRVEAVSDLVPTLLHLFFDVLIAEGEEDHLFELFPVMFERLDQLFPLETYIKAVNRAVVTKVLAVFHRWPSFVAIHKDLIVNVVADSTHSTRKELVLHLCWCIGEYCNPVIEPRCSPRVLNEYHEVLELVIYERMSLVKLGLDSLHEPDVIPRGREDVSSGTGGGGREVRQAGKDVYTTRFILVVMSALGKLASRWQDLANRVMLCLSKLMRDHHYFHPSVLYRANEIVQVLKYPSIASAVLDTPLPDLDEEESSYVDEYTPLPFLLMPDHTTLHEGASILHEFDL